MKILQNLFKLELHQFSLIFFNFCYKLTMRKLIIFSICFIFLLGLGFVPRNLYAEVLTGSVIAVPDSFSERGGSFLNLWIPIL